jgi:phage FluMu protein Com
MRGKAKPEPRIKPEPNLRLEKPPVGSTYCHWPILAHVKGGYLAQCPRCKEEIFRTKSSMEHSVQCGRCARKKRGRAVALPLRAGAAPSGYVPGVPQ